MQLIGIIAAALVILAAAHAIAGVLALLLLVMLVWGVYSRPAETFGLLAFFVLATLLKAHPALCLLALILVTTVALVSNASIHAGGRRSSGQPSTPKLNDRRDFDQAP